MMLRPLSTLLMLSALSGEPEPLGFDVLAGFDYTEGMTLPKEVSDWDEKQVKIRGFMRREFPGDGPVNSFMLINDNCGCTGTPKLNEIVLHAARRRDRGRTVGRDGRKPTSAKRRKTAASS